jgi:hypothetical protein
VSVWCSCCPDATTCRRRDRCSLCRSTTYTPGCARCELRQPSFFETPPPPPPSEAELSADEAAERERLRAVSARHQRLQAFHALGRKVVVTLIGCGKTKVSHRAQARELYLGTLFRRSLQYALLASDEVYVLSALHGLVGLDDELDPYDFAMKDRPVSDRERWARRVVSDLGVRLPGLPLRITCLAGADYANPLFRPLLERGVVLERPLAHFGVGERLRWLATETQPLTPPKRPRRRRTATERK